MTRVLVFWAEGKSANLGVQALYGGLEELLKKQHVPFELVGVSHETSAHPGGRPNRKNLVVSIVRKTPLRELIRSADIVVDLGEGDSLSDLYGLDRLQALVLSKLLCWRVGRRPVLGPQTLGPFDSMAGLVLGLAAILICRPERWSRDELSVRSLPRYVRPTLRVSADLAFALKPAARRQKVEAYDVGINISGYLWRHGNRDWREKYRLSMTSLIETLLARGESLAVIPHVWNPGSVDDDVVVSNEIVRRFDGAVSMPLRTPDAREAKALLGSCDLVVAGRMHAAIGAVSQGVATIPIAYSRKFEGVFGDLGYDWTVRLSSSRYNEELAAALNAASKMRSDAAASSAVARARLDQFLAFLGDAL